mmetsp:Transcript_101084/g.257112  ORF Transcript_101084/g.257112 Transcript_101084/m.257112 type:complete len:342 (-) Transcript_101084:2-1027(-)
MVDTHITVLTSGNEAFAIATPRQSVHRSEVTLYTADLLAEHHVPKNGLELARRAGCRRDILGILATTHQDVVLGIFLCIVQRRNSSIVEWSVGLEGFDELVFFVHGPQLRGLVFRAREHQHPVLGEADAGHRALVRIDLVDLGALRRIPDDDVALLENGNQRLVEGAPLHLRGLHRQIVVDGKQLLRRLELPDHDAIRNELGRALELVVARDDHVLLPGLLVKLDILQDAAVVEGVNLLALQSVKDELAICSGRHDILAVHGDVDGEDGPSLVAHRVVGADTLAVVRAHEASVTILGTRKEKVAVVAELDHGERTVVYVEQVRFHGCCWKLLTPLVLTKWP